MLVGGSYLGGRGEMGNLWLGVVFCRTVLVRGSDLGSRRGYRESSALGLRFIALCWPEGVILVVGGHKVNSLP